MFVGQNSNRVGPPDNALTFAAAMSHGIEKLLGKRKFGSLRRSKPKLRSSTTVPSLQSFRSEPALGLASTPVLEEPVSVAEKNSLFPQPSFIRPRDNRMVARDEVSPASKPCPLPSGITEPAKGGSRPARSSVGYSGPASESASFPIPRRASSLTRGKGGPSSLSSLVHYEFPERENSNAVRSLSSLCGSQRPTGLSPRSPKSMRAELDAAFSRQAAAISASGETPPPSDHDESRPQSPSSETPTRPPSLARGTSTRNSGQPTPGPSPALVPIPNSPSQSPRSSQDANERRPSLQSLLLPQTPLPDAADFAAVSDPILQEPDLGDFLGLSDDDIAESRPPSPALPIAAASPAVKGSLASVHTGDLLVPPRTPPTAHRRDSRVFNDSPKAKQIPKMPPPSPMSIRRISARLSLATNEDRAAAMAAFEVARIAASLASATSKRDSGSSIRTSHRDSSSLRFSDMASPDLSLRLSDAEVPATPTSWGMDDEVGLNYRFLAAYGLHTVKAPLQIAYGVHNKILQTEGWIEYRGTEPDDYQRGYARSFYTGYVPECEDGARRPSTAAQSASGSFANRVASLSTGAQGKQPEGPHGQAHSSGLGDDHGRSEHNRGIVFAAYRKPRPGEEPASMTAAERMDMQQDAQGLVDMILDCHLVKRRSEQREKFETMALKNGGFGDVGGRRLESAECGSKMGSRPLADGARARASI
ncbi:hypothetical protein MAPG_03396 [Magnaporthiopsis poae ATCC 64411]|uniref:Uncharacterized protein n=1 Tax=Magnaporthiopsis poae (strain ATCC 64411 / 73-15) TaxID=644358 RepID=A0A0C4DTW8_MAGP6|nr:hypothetical protein MAPG_03396 [Magnaporthiopsis poae ATCC 64411]